MGASRVVRNPAVAGLQPASAAYAPVSVGLTIRPGGLSLPPWLRWPRAVEPEGRSSVRVVVADDGALFRDGLVMLLERAGHDVVGACADGDRLLRLAATERPDIALLDIRMPPG
ncbi:MAG: response regulator transcription factor, partial [Nocardioides sp.]